MVKDLVMVMVMAMVMVVGMVKAMVVVMVMAMKSLAEQMVPIRTIPLVIMAFRGM